MKTKVLAASLILTALAACTSAPAKDKSAPAKPEPSKPATPAKPAPAENSFAEAPALKWDIVTKEDANSGAPQASVKLIANGKSAVFVTGLNLAPIEKADWEKNKVPADALLALGGWWAGGGDYYYVKLEKGKLAAYHAVEEEGSKPGRKYKLMKKFGPADFK